jgi:hypothetical protein
MSLDAHTTTWKGVVVVVVVVVVVLAVAVAVAAVAEVPAVVVEVVGGAKSDIIR